MVYEFNDEIFPKNLKYLRRKNGLSQIELARRSGVCVYLIRGVEHRRFYARMLGEDYERLCRVLRVDPNLLASYDLSINNKI